MHYKVVLLIKATLHLKTLHLQQGEIVFDMTIMTGEGQAFELSEFINLCDGGFGDYPSNM